MQKIVFLLAAMSLTAVGFSADPVKLKWETPLDFRGTATGRVYIEALYALPGSRTSVVLSRYDTVSPFRSLLFANLSSLGVISASESLTPQGVGEHVYRASAIDTTGRLYLSSNTDTFLYSMWHRFSQTGTRLVTRDKRSPVSSMVAEPFGTTYEVAGGETGGSALIKRDMYGTQKWASPHPVGVGNGTSRTFLDAQGNIHVIATGQNFGSPEGGTASFIRKVSPAGAILTHVSLPLANNEVVVEAGRDKDGNYVALVDRYVSSDSFVTLRKFRATDGAELWSRDIAFRTNPGMVLDGQGRAWVIRSTGNFTGELLQYSKTGALNWTSVYATMRPDKITLDSTDEGYILGSTTDGRGLMFKHAGNGIARFSHALASPTGRRSASAISVENESGNIFLGTTFTPEGEKSYSLLSCLMQAPFVRNDVFNVPANQATQVGPINANDSYKQNALLTIVRQPANGSLPYVGQDGKVTYQPNAGFVGQDSFTYRLSRGPLVSYTATVTLNVQ